MSEDPKNKPKSKLREIVTEIEEVEIGARRTFTGPIYTLIAIVAVLFSLFEIAVLGFVLVDLWVFEAISTIFVLVLGFLLIPGSKKDTTVKWWDIAFMLIGIAPCVYVMFQIDRLSRFYGATWTSLDVVMSGMLIVALLVLIKRSFSWPFLIVMFGFLAYVFFGQYLPPELFGHSPLKVDRVLSFLFGLEGIFGTIASTFVRIIFLFMLFSAFFQASGASDFLVKLANSLAGRWRGGPAKVAVLASSLFGTISGNSVANVVTMGVFTIPLMKKMGYQAHFAGAVEATASTGGTIMPPVMGSAAFIMAQFLGIPYRDIIIAAIIPAVLYFTCIFFQVDLEAVRSGMKGLPKDETPKLSHVLMDGGHLMLPLVVLVFMLFILGASLTRTALVTILSVVVISWLKKSTRMTPRKVIDALAAGARGSVSIGAICLGAGIMIGAINMTGLGVQFSSTVIHFAGNNLPLVLFAVAIACIILGLALPSTASYIIAAAVGAPALINLGVLPLAAHLFVFYFAMMAPISPPVGSAYFAAAGIAGGSVDKTGWTAMRLAAAALVVPFLFVYHSEIIMQGSPLDIITMFLLTAFGLSVFAMGVEGTSYIGGIRWYPWHRVLFIVSAAGLIIPGWITSVSGAAILIVALLSHPKVWHFIGSKLKRGRPGETLAGGANGGTTVPEGDSHDAGKK